MIKQIYVKNYQHRYFFSQREKNRAVMVLGNFSYDHWKLSQSRVNLDLNHILVAGKVPKEVKFAINYHFSSPIVDHLLSALTN